MDLNRLAHRIVDKATTPEAKPKSAAQVNGHKGGTRGGRARAAKLTAAERTDIARKAARARWAKPT